VVVCSIDIPPPDSTTKSESKDPEARARDEDSYMMMPNWNINWLRYWLTVTQVTHGMIKASGWSKLLYIITSEESAYWPLV